MDTMQKVVLIAHTFIAIMIIVLVLLQRGKGADAGAAFGAGASGTVFGARGSSNFFSRATAILATVFFASSLTLAYMSSQRADSPSSLIERAPAAAPLQEPEETLPDRAADPDQDFPSLEDASGSGADAGDLPSLEAEEPQAEDDNGQNSGENPQN